MKTTLSALDHVQIAMPVGEEETARRFYRDLLGLQELPKPPALARRGGAWFQGPGFQLHLGVEQDFRPAKKAHPAFRSLDLDGLQQVLEAAGYPTTDDHEIPSLRRFYVNDPFGNRLEFQEDMGLT